MSNVLLHDFYDLNVCDNNFNTIFIDEWDERNSYNSTITYNIEYLNKNKIRIILRNYIKSHLVTPIH